MKCDFCGKDFNKYDLERKMFGKGRVKYMCYRCKGKCDIELKKHKVAGMEKKGLIGEK